MTSELLTSVDRLTKDLRAAATTLSHNEARFLVDAYYQMQEDRIRSYNQTRALIESDEPNVVVRWLGDQSAVLETNVKVALDKYTQAHVVGRWARSVCGIGPVIAAGLLAHISMEHWRCSRGFDRPKTCGPKTPCTPLCSMNKVRTAGQVWRFAGQDPTTTWEKGQKRPHNAKLKTLCWKIGESFVKVSGREDDFYGKLYVQRKELELARNERHEFAAQATAKLERFNIGKTTDAYKAYAQGRLPPAHIHARAKRYAVKIFLAHYFEVAYFAHHGERAPKPYVIEHLGHAHEIQVPNWPF